MRRAYSNVIKTIRLCMKIFWNYKIIHGERLETSDNCILVANHISAYDPLFLGSLLKKEIFFLAKSELFKNKFFGNILQYFNAISIKRGAVDRTAINRVLDKLNTGRTMLIFPEGTRKSNKPKAGIGKIAIQANKNILPIFIKNSNKLGKCFMGKERLTFVVGKYLKIDNFIKIGETTDNYRNLASFVLEKINELEHEC